MKNLLFLGGTSFFGMQIIKNLITTKKYSITILTRGNHLPSEFTNSINFIKCDRSDSNALSDSLKNKDFDIVVDNIAYTAEDVKNILQIFNNRISHYLLCSTGAVYSENSFHEWKESEAILTPIEGARSYSNNKRKAECELLNYKKIPYTIYRPTVVEGPGDRTKRTQYFIKKIQQQDFFYIPDEVIFKHVYSNDIANVVEQLISLEPRNCTYNICGDEKISIQSYCDRIAHLLKKKPCYKTLPKTEFIISYNNFPSSYERTLLLSNDLIKRTIDYRFTSIDHWLPITVQWNLSHP